MKTLDCLSTFSEDSTMSSDSLISLDDLIPHGLMQIVTGDAELEDTPCGDHQSTTSSGSGGKSDDVKNSDDDDDDEETYGPAQIQAVLSKCKKDSSVKPKMSYIALISLAILSNPQKKMLLAEIYHWVHENVAYYRVREKSWRNSIRHNLSLNECFIKAGRSDNGKGNYWTIHSACADNFLRGDFRRRRARRLVRKYDHGDYEKLADILFPENQCAVDRTSADTYVPMTTTRASGDTLISIFGPEAILTRQEMKETGYNSDGTSIASKQTVTSQLNYNATPSNQQVWQPPVQDKHDNLSTGEYIWDTKHSNQGGIPPLNEQTWDMKDNNQMIMVQSPTENSYSTYSVPGQSNRQYQVMDTDQFMAASYSFI